mmetsp:Transcript_103695/g.246876  ORF Transcript_103695/g.246876 Transcript_103695/m.246876 type:complete len:218 (+) Transcript_103695:174-827(+)
MDSETTGSCRRSIPSSTPRRGCQESRHASDTEGRARAQPFGSCFQPRQHCPRRRRAEHPVCLSPERLRFDTVDFGDHPGHRTDGCVHRFSIAACQQEPAGSLGATTRPGLYLFGPRRLRRSRGRAHRLRDQRRSLVRARHLHGHERRERLSSLSGGRGRRSFRDLLCPCSRDGLHPNAGLLLPLRGGIFSFGRGCGRPRCCGLYHEGVGESLRSLGP